MKKIIIPVLMIILIAPSVFGAFLVAEFSDNTVGYYNGEESFKFEVPQGPNKIALTSDNSKAVVTSSIGNSITVLDINNKKVLTSLEVKDAEPFGVAITSDNKYALVANIDKGTVSVVDLESLKIIKTIIVDDSPTNIAVTPDNKFAYVTNLGSSSVTIIDLNLMKPIKKIQNPNLIRSPAMIDIGKDNAYFFNTRKNVLKAISLEQQSLLNFELPAANVNINNDMKIVTEFAIITGELEGEKEDEGVIQIIDLKDKQVLKDIKLDTSLYGLDYDKGSAYVSTSENEVFIVNISNSEFERIKVGEKPRGIVVLKEASELNGMPAKTTDITIPNQTNEDEEQKKSFLIPILIIIAIVFIIPWIFRPKVFDEETKIVKPKKVEILKNGSKKETKTNEAKNESKASIAKKETKKENMNKESKNEEIKTEKAESKGEKKEDKEKSKLTKTKDFKTKETKEDKEEIKQRKSELKEEKIDSKEINNEIKKVTKKNQKKKINKKEELKGVEDDEWIDMEELSDDEWEKMINE